MTKAIEINPKQAHFYYIRATAYAKKSDHDRAIADFTKAIEADPKDADYYYFRGAAYANNNDHDRAIADFTQALVRNPKDGFTYVARARSYIAKNDPDRAIADYKSVVELPAATEAMRRLQETARGRIQQLTSIRLAPAQK